MDTTSQILQSADYLLLLIILIVLAGKVIRRHEIRTFWMLLALAWTMNLFGNIAWVIHDLTTGTPLNTFSAVDLFYGARYVLIGIAIWLYPMPLSRRDGIWAGAVTVIANIMIWAIYFNPAMKIRGGDWTGFLGLAMYPALDTALIMLAWFRFRAVQEGWQAKFFLLLFCAMASYGVANTLNLTGYVFPSMNSGILPNIFWILTNIFLLLMTFGFSETKEKGWWSTQAVSAQNAIEKR